VSYVYDALYDVHVTYQRSGQIKIIVLPSGFAGGAGIIPTASDIVIADDKAEGHKLESNQLTK